MKAKKPDIVLLYPTRTGNFLRNHLGAAYISAHLANNGFRALQYSDKGASCLLELARKILATGSRIYGFTCYNHNYFLIKYLIHQLKALDPGILIVAGGPTATFSDALLLSNIPGLDLCVRGEGEYAALELIRCFKNGGGFESLAGTTVRLGRRIVRNPDRPLIQGATGSLDILPSPYLSGRFDLEALKAEEDAFPVTTSRGCIYRCTYCNFAAISRNTVRFHSAERVVQELAAIYSGTGKSKTSKVTFYDDCFTLDHRRVRRICEGIIERGIKLRIDINTRADHVDEALLRLLYRAGVSKINFGLESISPRVLYNVKKVRLAYPGIPGFGPEKRFIRSLARSVKTAKRIGFKVTLSLIFGLPGETEKDGRKNISFVKKLGVDGYIHNYLRLFPGTELFTQLVKPGKKLSESSLLQNRHAFFSRIYGYNVFNIPEGEDTISGTKNEQNQLFFELIFALGADYREETKTTTDVIVLNGKPPMKDLIKHIPVNARVFYGKGLENLKGRESKLKIRRERMAELLGGQTPDSQKIYFMNTPFTDGVFGKSYILQGFSQWKKAAAPPKILAINDDRDLSAFCDYIRRDCRNLSGRLFDSGQYLLLDSCRWSGRCPAVSGSRVLVGKDLRIRPCYNCKVSARIGDNAKLIRDFLAQRCREEEKRGCQNCPAASFCSKCPFLGRITPAKYCSVNRQYFRKINQFLYLVRAKAGIPLV